MRQSRTVRCWPRVDRGQHHFQLGGEAPESFGDRYPIFRQGKVNHTDFPASCSITPQSRARARTMSSPRPCGSSSWGFLGTGRPGPPSVTAPLRVLASRCSSTSIGPYPCSTALVTSSLMINSAAATACSSQSANSDRIRSLAIEGLSVVAERRFTLLTAPSLSCCQGAHIQCRPLVNRNRPILWIGGQIDPKQRNPVARRPESASASPCDTGGAANH